MAVANLSWTPPSVDALAYNNCTLTAAWWSDGIVDGIRSTTISRSIAYLNSSLPRNIAVWPTDAQLIAWYVGDDRVFEWMQNGWIHCDAARDEFCATFGSAGNSELAGIGTFISYHVEAALASLYAIAMLFDCHGGGSHLGEKSATGSYYGRALRAFRESSVGFLDSALVFSAVLQVAGIVQSAQALADDGKIFTTYTGGVSMMAAMLSAFAAALLQSATIWSRRRKLRLVTWLLLLALIIANLALLNRVAAQFDPDDPQSKWEYNCLPQPSFSLEALGYSTAAIFLVAVIWIFASLKLRADRLPGMVGRLAFALACLVMMWVTLGLLTAWRDTVSRVAGENDQDLEWTFGQILALATWVPVLIEWGYVFIFGPVEGLQGKMSSRYTVSRVPESS